MKNILQIYIILALIVLIPLSCNNPVKNENSSDYDKMIIEGLGKFPHSEEFKATAAHGEPYLNNPQICAKCHGNDFSGGSSQKSCHTCHGNQFPHPPHWALPQNHGQHFKKLTSIKLKNMCYSCHALKESESTNTTNLNPTTTIEKEHPSKSGPIPVTCTQCHSYYPHKMDISVDEIKEGTRKESLEDLKNEQNPSGNSVITSQKFGKEKDTEANKESGGLDKEEKLDAMLENFYSKYPYLKKAQTYFNIHNHANVARGVKGSCFGCHKNGQIEPSNDASSCYECHSNKSEPRVHWMTTANPSKNKEAILKTKTSDKRAPSSKK